MGGGKQTFLIIPSKTSRGRLVSDPSRRRLFWARLFCGREFVCLIRLTIVIKRSNLLISTLLFGVLDRTWY